MAKDDDTSIFDELDSRLDDFFAEDDQLFSEDDIAEDNDGGLVEDVEIPETEETSEEVELPVDPVDESAPLNRLKAIVLEMDWEISDENLRLYLDEINRLITRYKEDRPIYLFFRLHVAIGKYMLTKKAHAHPDALKFLYSVYNSLEKAIIADIPILDKNRLILSEVNHFKRLKHKLFPNFTPDSEELEAHLNEKNIQDETGSQGESDDDDLAYEAPSFDMSSLPEDVQRGVSEFIEKSIAEKLENIKKELQNS